MAFLDDPDTATQLVSFMMQAALAGASEALRNRAIGLEASAKSEADGDFVTQGDKASQAAIFMLLPTEMEMAGMEVGGVMQPIGFFAEEAMHEGYVFPEDAPWRWCVDPIDGTKPYYNGESCWSVSVALQQRADDGWRSVAGVLYRAAGADMPDHLSGRIYWAIEGKGAYVMDMTTGEQRRIAMPEAVQPVVEFETVPEVPDPKTQDYVQQVSALLEDAGMRHTWRRSICHSVCELLEGEKAAVVQGVAGPFDWDIAAVAVIVAEAGVHATFAPRVQADGHWRYPAIIAWDKTLFDRLVAVFN